MSVQKVLEVLADMGYNINDAIKLLEETEWGWSANCKIEQLNEWLNNNKPSN